MYAAQTVQREDMRKKHRARALRKQREKRKMILLIVLTLVVIFVIGMGFGSMITRAKEPATPDMYKYYANVEIQDGDTLWDLAKRYQTTEEKIKAVNGMEREELEKGEKLILY